MSLKAKIEAVIYAAEEPVTLAQLSAIFAAEVPLPPIDAEAAVEASSGAQQLEVPLAEHEITRLDEAGTMTDVPPASEEIPEATVDISAPLAAGTLDDPILEDAPAPESAASLEDPQAAEKRAARKRETEVRNHLRALVDELVSDYAVQDRGIEIREIAGGYRMATKPEYHDAVRAFVKSLKPPMKLSLQALETLAVIAYKQPVTSPEVAEIRGVDSGGVLANLISRKLVTTAGRKQVIGRPILYKTTKEFLLRFGLKDIAELPSMEEFEKMAGELAESDALEASALEDRAGIPPIAEDEAQALPFEEHTPEHVAELSSRAESNKVEEHASPHDATDDEPKHVTETVSSGQES
jgi:segregation and condensation protein B